MQTNVAAARVESDDAFLTAVSNGLSRAQKFIPSTYLYDERGSELFEEITALPEYYPTRTEVALLNKCGPEIGLLVPPHSGVTEFGSGSSRKTELLLAALDHPSCYVPMDVSSSALMPAADRISKLFPAIAVKPLLASFDSLDDVTLPEIDGPWLGFFPGSTIGNFTRPQAASFLRQAKELLGPRSGFLLGADLEKAPSVLIPAYDDSAGVTAAFNLNLLERINRELDGGFDVRLFRHEARYNGVERRIEMHLRSTIAQTVSVAGRPYRFREGETIHTENSHKYSLRSLHGLASAGGWNVARFWTDEGRNFSLSFLTQDA